MKRFLMTSALVLAATLSAAETQDPSAAQTQNSQNSAVEMTDRNKLSSNYATYPEPKNEKYTKAPAGYKPFYLTHYGRHGSRFHQPAAHYNYLYETLAKADSAKVLTEKGEDLLKKAKYLNEYAAPRAGDLTQLGVKQHQGIAKRMIKNFPEIFKGKGRIDAFASTSVRCVVSMAAFLEEVKAEVPKSEIHQESGGYLMKFINPMNFGTVIKEANTEAWQKENEKLYSHVNPAPMMAAIFKDSLYVKQNVDAGDLLSKIYEIGNNLRNVEEIDFNFDDLWSDQLLFARWKAQNAWWYSVLGNCPLTGNKGPGLMKPLLQNILDLADSAIAKDTLSGKHQPVAATLRFGHDTAIMPLVGLLGLDVAKANTADMENLHQEWKDYEIIPMAANLQMVFYKSVKKGAPILVKALYNEIEVKLPVICNLPDQKNCPAAPYYRWEDVKSTYQQVLAQ